MKSKHIGKKMVYILLCVMLFASALAANVDDEVLRQVQEEGTADVIIVLNEENDVKSVQEEFLNDVDVEHHYEMIPAIAGKVTEEGIKKLGKNPLVKEIVIDEVNTLFLDESVPFINATTLPRVNGTVINGSGESVCIIDSGIDYTHAAFGACAPGSVMNDSCPKVIAGYDYCADNINCTTEDADPDDVLGHGTMVSGIVASQDETYRGVAPGAKIVMMKVCNSVGLCRDSDVLSAIEWCTMNATKYNISVISISLGGGQFSSYCDNNINSQYASLINQAVGKNISVVIATGNTNAAFPNATAGIAAPACIANATRVSATSHSSDTIAGYAFRHQNFPDTLLAPGTSITSTGLRGGFSSGSGTSFSAPHIAGAIALIQQYYQLVNNASLTPLQLKQVFNLTGKKIVDGSTGSTFSRIDVNATINSLDTVAPQITFREPTPANGTIKTTITIAVSSSEILASALLEWNGVNESMEGSGYAFHKEINGLEKGNNYTFRVWGSDFIGNLGVSEARRVKVNNLPQVAFANITPAAPRTLDNLTCMNGSVSDADNDSVTLHYRWYKGTSRWDLVDQNLTTRVVPANATRRDEWWQCVITPYDGEENGTAVNSSLIRIDNSPPTAVTLVHPLSGDFTGATVHFNWSAADDDDDDLLSYFLFVSGNSSFASPLINKSVNGTNVTVTVNESIYYWRVASCDRDICSYSENVSFEVDSTPPDIQLTSLILNNSFGVIPFSVSENNLAGCHYTLSRNSTTHSSGDLGNATIIFLTELLNGNYTMSVSCSDYAQNSNTVNRTITVRDITVPSVTLTTTSTGTSSVTLTLTATTNEPATCKYSVTDSAYADMNAMVSSNRTHTFTQTYGEDTTGTYYVRCQDANGNIMNTSEVIAFSVDVEESASPSTGSSGSSSSGGGGGTTSKRRSTGQRNDEQQRVQREALQEQLLERLAALQAVEEEQGQKQDEQEAQARRAIEEVQQLAEGLSDEELQELLQVAREYADDGNYASALDIAKEAKVLAMQIRSALDKEEITPASALTGAAILTQVKAFSKHVPFAPIGIGMAIILMSVAGYVFIVKPKFRTK
jgi:hypothetical protein